MQCSPLLPQIGCVAIVVVAVVDERLCPAAMTSCPHTQTHSAIRKGNTVARSAYDQKGPRGRSFFRSSSEFYCNYFN